MKALIKEHAIGLSCAQDDTPLILCKPGQGSIAREQISTMLEQQSIDARESSGYGFSVVLRLHFGAIEGWPVVTARHRHLFPREPHLIGAGSLPQQNWKGGELACCPAR